MKRVVIPVALCVLLAACFKSEHLLVDLGTAAHPIPEGEWVAGDSSDTVFTLKINGDHYLRTEDKNTYDLVLVPLAGHAAPPRARHPCRIRPAGHRQRRRRAHALRREGARDLREDHFHPHLQRPGQGTGGSELPRR